MWCVVEAPLSSTGAWSQPFDRPRVAQRQAVHPADLLGDMDMDRRVTRPDASTCLHATLGTARSECRQRRRAMWNFPPCVIARPGAGGCRCRDRSAPPLDSGRPSKPPVMQRRQQRQAIPASRSFDQRQTSPRDRRGVCLGDDGCSEIRKPACAAFAHLDVQLRRDGARCVAGVYGCGGIVSRQVQKLSSVCVRRSANPAIARWNACECRFGIPGST